MVTFVMYLKRTYFKLESMNIKLRSNLYPNLGASLLKVAMLTLMGFCTTVINGQGWEMVFETPSVDEGRSVIQTEDRGFVVTGFSEAFGADADLDVYVIRTDVDGTKIWSNYYDEGWVEHGYSTIQTADKDFLIVGDIRNTQLENAQVYLLKIGQNGEFRWSKQFGGTEIEQGFDVAATSDGGFIIVGRTNSFGNGGDDVYLIKVDAEGNELWSKTFGDTGNDVGRSVIEVADGYVIAGSIHDLTSDSRDIYILKTDFDGNEIWSKNFGNDTGDDFDQGYDVIQTSDGNLTVTGFFGANSNAAIIKLNQSGDELWTKMYGGDLADQTYQIIEIENGDLVAVGSTEETPANVNVFLVRTDADGNEIWTNEIGRTNYLDSGQSIFQTADGGFIIAGQTIEFNAFLVPDITLIKTNAQGNIYSNRLQGYVFNDVEDDCNLGVDDIGLNDWLIKAESSEHTFFGTTDENGFYNIIIDTGNYEVSVLVKNDYWDAQCIPVYQNVLFTNVYDTLTRNFPILPVVDCPLLEVDVTTPIAQNCSNIAYTINYCNFGTIAADMSSCEIILDEDLTLTGSTATLISQMDSLYVFELGEIDSEECDSFQIFVESACNGIPFYELSVEAHILPDSLCIPPSPSWDSAFIQVNGYCDGDSVRFNIQNIGDGDMEETLNYIVIEDIIIGLTGGYMLTSDNGIEITRASDGTTKRIIAEQSDGHPGNSYPTVAIEGCDNGLGSISTGMVTMFQEDENNSFISIDVQESVSPGQSVANLRGYPKGYPVDNDGYDYIKANTDIEYQITFQNTSTDTIQRIVIRDTLSTNLDITTVRPGASSHPYDFEIYDSGILKITFEDINLPPDSSASNNSYGSVKFKISQKSNLATGVIIPNSAAIFSQYDAPFQSVEKEYKIGGDSLIQFVIINDATEVFVPNVKLEAFPNPFVDAIFFEIKGKTIQEGIFNLYDLNGRQLRKESFSGNDFQVYRKNLTTGMYVFKIEADGQWISSGKILVQ